MRHLSNYFLSDSLAALSPQDFETIRCIVGASTEYMTAHDIRWDKTRPGRKCGDRALVTNFSRFAANKAVNVVRSNGDPVGYLEILDKVLNAVGKEGQNQNPYLDNTVRHQMGDRWPVDNVQLIGIDAFAPDASRLCFQLLYEEMLKNEEAILACIAAAIYEKMTPEQRADFDRKLKEITAKESRPPIAAVATTGGLLLLGNLGGFGTYMLMSSLLSTISFGTLGFGAYTAASSVLSFLLGPVGWAALGAVAVHQLGKPDLNKLTSMVITIAMARRMQPEQANDYEKMRQSIESNLPEDVPFQSLGSGIKFLDKNFDDFQEGRRLAMRKNAIRSVEFLLAGKGRA